MRLSKYKGFLPIKINDGKATVYAIGLDDVPNRKYWKLNKVNAVGPAYISEPAMTPRLIDGPIVLQSDEAGAV